MSDTTPRWKYRFANYRRAFTLLREAVEKEEPLSQLEKEGLIQRFEYSTELAWKTMKDYLESEGMVLDQITPRTVIRSAFEAGIISRGETWQKALDARNLMSHTYDLKVFEQAIAEIKSSYLSAYGELYEFLMAKDLDGGR
jgi:nucleotidyltransferase substrate binding protein (TIGR01987 family)